MSLIETIAVFTIGVIVGAYGAYLAHPLIEAGLSLMILKKEEQRAQKIFEEKEAKAKNDSTNAATQPCEEQTTPRPTPTQNHSTTKPKQNPKPNPAATTPQETTLKQESAATTPSN